MKYLKSCKSCISNKGEKRISPAKPIYKGKYWRIEHAYPCGLKGWLILLPNRHVEALHELTPNEMKEFGEIFPKVPKALHRILNCEKEYAIQLAEGAGFNHVHFHIIAKPKGTPKKYQGTEIFYYLADAKSISKEEVISFCDNLSKELDKFIKSENFKK
jgi:diadenosine tetraphosphate (Ap4A) HIT family hydrolase